MSTATIPRPAMILGAAGLLPFGAGALALLVGPETIQSFAETALLAYGAVILSFMGGCRWGFAAAGLGAGPDWMPLGLSVLPALLGWGAMLAIPFTGAALIIAAGFAALFAADVALTRAGGAPLWWPRLRLPLTLGAAGCLTLGAIA
ncbi:MAG: DUF3429 domain-containing protein [Pseudomonadota bacterium]